ncbi:arsenate reductase/protein-tyrosine-phosphatase family protein [Pararhodobacter sp.]|jgi:protein-tyrosine phosphatase|uniref:arsenate reductase/protein-tyrosine-phosphatase family protein n=1 Tax=Pararhodobacter sp. TaxID=2127056 RepID=UPI002FDEABE7
MGMIRSVLVVCVGNVCRSPVAERKLRARLDETLISVSSAGLGALEGKGADDCTTQIAAQHGLSLEGHVARQFTPALGRKNDLILVMETVHKNAIAWQAPELSGRCLLFDQWTGARGIADPYRKSLEFHENVFQAISAAGDAWSDWLLKNVLDRR